jgi:hypothetical protein
MAETRTTRFSLPQWGAGTDAPSRSDFNEAFLQLETWAARDEQGTFASRPAFGMRGRYYWDTTNTVLWRDTGTSWVVVGSGVQDELTVASVAGNNALRVRGASSQTADIMQVQNNSGTVLNAFTSAGDLANAYGRLVGGSGTALARQGNATLSLTPSAAANPAIVLKAQASQTGDLAQFMDSSNSVLSKVGPDGSITAPKVMVTNTTPSASGDLVSKGYVDSGFLPYSGGTLSGALSLNSGGSSEYIDLPGVGDALNLRVSRAAARDLTALQVTSTGQVKIGALTGAQASVVPLVVGAAPGQTANILQVLNAAGTAVGWFDNNGNFYSKNFGSGTTSQRTATTTTTNLNDGAIWWDTDDSTFYKWSGGAWSLFVPTTFSASAITSGTLPIARGGTGATSASSALTTLGAAATNHTHVPGDIVGNINAYTVRGRAIVVSSSQPSAVKGDVWIKTPFSL